MNAPAAVNTPTEAEVLRAIDSCGGSHGPAEKEWGRGYDDALEAVAAEVTKLFARVAGGGK